MWATSLSGRKLWTADNLPEKDCECQSQGKLLWGAWGKLNRQQKCVSPSQLCNQTDVREDVRREEQSWQSPAHARTTESTERMNHYYNFSSGLGPLGLRKEKFCHEPLCWLVQLPSWTVTSLSHQTGKPVIHKNLCIYVFPISFSLHCWFGLKAKYKTANLQLNILSCQWFLSLLQSGCAFSYSLL